MRLSLIACLVSCSLLAQEQTFRTTVNVVVAPTTVIDRRGNFVHDLKPHEFRVLDKGVPQDIRVDVSFLPISLVVAVQADAADAATPASPRPPTRRLANSSRAEPASSAGFGWS